MKYESLQSVTQVYKNSVDVHRDIYFSFKENVNATPFLKQHRDFVVQHRHGYGNRAFHWLWKLLVDEMPDGFTFLEIGVFKGQVLSLVALCANKIEKRFQQYGVTPLDSTDKHPDEDYETAILQIFQTFLGNIDNTQIIEGLSTNPEVTKTVDSVRGDGFDMVYIDGGHAYDVVTYDLKTYPRMLKSGGYLVVDDCSNFLNMPSDICLSYTYPKFQCIGIPEVSQAVKEQIEPDPTYIHQLACGHIRVWRKQ